MKLQIAVQRASLIFQKRFQNALKLESHWDATNWPLVGDKGLQYKRDFSTIFTLRSH